MAKKPQDYMVPSYSGKPSRVIKDVVDKRMTHTGYIKRTKTPAIRSTGVTRISSR